MSRKLKEREKKEILLMGHTGWRMVKEQTSMVKEQVVARKVRDI